MMHRQIGLLDCNSFFVNCELLFKEEIRHLPAVVLSNNDGCVVARNKLAKECGVAMGEPYFKIKQLCQKYNITAFSSNFSLYMDISSRIMKTLKKHVPVIEVYSVDEAFFDITGIKNTRKYAQNLKRIIEREVGVPVSVGVGKTKQLAKCACRMAKKIESLNGSFVLDNKEREDWTLEKISVDKLWGVARGRSLRLRSLGIKTAKQFRDYKHDHQIQRELTKAGRQIQDELRGIICFPVGEMANKKKEMMSSRTFSASIYDKRDLAQAIATHASDVAAELRMQGSVCRSVMPFIRSNPFREDQQQYRGARIKKFLTPTSNTFKIISAALECLDEMFILGIEYKKAGVRVMSLQDKKEHNLSLFEPYDSYQDDNLMKVIDRINLKEGPHMIRSLSCGTGQLTHRMNRNFLSPRYTTSIKDLPKLS